MNRFLPHTTQEKKIDESKITVKTFKTLKYNNLF